MVDHLIFLCFSEVGEGSRSGLVFVGRCKRFVKGFEKGHGFENLAVCGGVVLVVCVCKKSEIHLYFLWFVGNVSWDDFWI